MPNWTYNSIFFKSKKIFDEVKSRFLDEEGEFDFNKLIKKPDNLDKTSSPKPNDLIALEIAKNNKKSSVIRELFRKYQIKYPNTRKNASQEKLVDYLEKECKERHYFIDGEFREKSLGYNPETKQFEDVVGLTGKEYLDLYNECGYYDWYDWSYANWGTKWNASNTNVDDKSLSIYFDTAWCLPEPVFQALCEEYPTEEIIFDSENEDPFVVINYNFGGELTEYGAYDAVFMEDEDGEYDGYEYPNRDEDLEYVCTHQTNTSNKILKSRRKEDQVA